MGSTFCLSLPLDYPGGNALFQHRKEPKFFHERRGDGYNYNFRLSNVAGCFSDVVSDDAVIMYTQYSTQWDGLGHVGQMFDANGDGIPEKVYYNGYRGGLEIVGPGDTASGFGAKADGIERLATARRAGPRRAGRPGAASWPRARAGRLRRADGGARRPGRRRSNRATSCACTPASPT